MTTPILWTIVAAPVLLLAACCFVAKAHGTQRTTLEQLVLLGMWLAKWMQATAEGLDSGLICYRDSMQARISSSAESMREQREAAAREALNAREHVERMRAAVQGPALPAARVPEARSAAWFRRLLKGNSEEERERTANYES
jgi:HAMP domain-containing protein